MFALDDKRHFEVTDEIVSQFRASTAHWITYFAAVIFGAVTMIWISQHLPSRPSGELEHFVISFIAACCAVVAGYMLRLALLTLVFAWVFRSFFRGLCFAFLIQAWAYTQRERV